MAGCNCECGKKIYAFKKNIEYTGAANKRTFVGLGYYANQGAVAGNGEQLTDMGSFPTAQRILEYVGIAATALTTNSTDKYYINNATCVYGITNTGNEACRVKIWKCRSVGIDSELLGPLDRMQKLFLQIPLCLLTEHCLLTILLVRS